MQKISVSQIIAMTWTLFVVLVSGFLMKPVFHENELLRLAIVLPIIVLGNIVLQKIYQRFRKS